MTTPRILTPYERTQLARYLGPQVPSDIPADIPIEYITGKVEFCDLVFSITPDALIPRIETEELVHRAERELRRLVAEAPQDRQLVVADVGTGCGAVLITLAHLFRTHGARISWLGSDISDTATAVASENATAVLGKDHTLQLFVSDLLQDYPAELMFDLLIANLPYIPHDRIAFLDASVNEHEPHLALDGGVDGLTLIHAFLREATARTRSGGVILLEMDYTHTADDFNIYRPDWIIRVEMDSFARNRFARLERK